MITFAYFFVFCLLVLLILLSVPVQVSSDLLERFFVHHDL